VKLDHVTDAQFEALGDSTRRAIFELVARSPRAVGELADALPISRPAVSQHLKVLKDAGLLSVRSEGTRNIYSADPDGLAILRASVERFWRDALVSFKASVEADVEQKGPKEK
jgi:DNA-binding transcriptional ArsR family regulator